METRPEIRRVNLWGERVSLRSSGRLRRSLDIDLRVELVEPGAPETGDLRFGDLGLMLVFLFHVIGRVLQVCMLF